MLAGKILLVEHEPRTRAHYAAGLKRAGYSVHGVGTGRGALRALERGRRPAAVVVDASLPDMRGVELLGEILARDADLPVVMHSAAWDCCDDFGSWGARAVVPKSPDPGILARCVDRLIGEPAHGGEPRAARPRENVG